MRRNPHAASACSPRTARRSAQDRRIHCSPRRWSRGRRPSTCWRWPASDRPQMSTSTRWTVAVMVVVVTLGVALWTQLGDSSSPTGSIAPGASRDRRDADTAEALAGPRARADLPPCPQAGSAPGPERLRGITLECAGDGTNVDVAKAVAGRPTVLNLWASWGAPGGEELPAVGGDQGGGVRAGRRGAARDGRVPAQGGTQCHRADGAPGRERGCGIAAAG